MSENLPTTAENRAPVVAGFGTRDSFELLQRQAALLSASDLVPKEYRGRDKVANCVIALEMANRIGANPLMVMQNLYLVHGRPSWSSQFLISGINSTGKFTPLRFQISEPEPEKEVPAEITYYEGNNKRTKTVKEKIRNQTCVAWVIEKATGERLESAPVSLEMAVKEGWYSKAGSKWQTMPDLMLRYRAASFFSRQYCPEVTMGLKTAEEERDIIDITPPAFDVPTSEDIVSRFTDPAPTAETVDVTTGEILDETEPAAGDTFEVQPEPEQVSPALAECPECHFKGGRHSPVCSMKKGEREPGIEG